MSGCVAVAVPIVAGAAIAGGKDVVGNRGKPGKMAGAAQPPHEAPDAEIANTPTISQSEMAALPSPSVTGPGLRHDDGETALVLTDLAQLPAPESSGMSTVRSSARLDRFTRYVLEQARPLAQILSGETQQMSALLAAPGTLNAERVACTASAPAVLIDLDPGKGTFDPLATPPHSPALTAALGQLREHGVAVVWISNLSENFSDSIRGSLMQSGLDPSGKDSILLMRHLDERKQTRREEIATSHCLIAILGDQRTDFDELYMYLRDPGTAQALEPLIDNGWFIDEGMLQ